MSRRGLRPRPSHPSAAYLLTRSGVEGTAYARARLQDAASVPPPSRALRPKRDLVRRGSGLEEVGVLDRDLVSILNDLEPLLELLLPHLLELFAFDLFKGAEPLL